MPVRRCVLAIGVLLLCGGGGLAQMEPAWMPAAEIVAGAVGTGRATFQSTRVSSYEFEVLDVLRGEAGVASAVLVRVRGAEIDRAGGIAQGMSGSPLYLDGRLACVLAYALPEADPHYGYAIPYEFCRPLLTGPTPVVALPAGLVGAVEARTGPPLALSSVVAQAETGALEPGSLVGLQVVRGAMHSTTYGTVTSVVEGRALLLGHKYLHEGRCEYPLVRASVGAVIPSARAPYLHASPMGEPIGTVVEDRAYGCAAVLGQTPRTVPLNLRILGERGEVALALACTPTEELFAETAASCVIAVADSVLDRVGPGSAEVRLGLVCGGGLTFDRSEMVSSDRDVGGACAAELRAVLRALLGNDRYPLAPESAEVTIAARPEPAPAEILGCEVTPTRARPGDEVLVTVRLRPFRQPIAQQQIRLRVPETAEGGLLTVRVHAKACNAPWTYDAWEQLPEAASAAAYLHQIEHAGLRRSLVCDLQENVLQALLRRAVARGFDESDSMDVRDVPEREAPDAASPLAALGLRPIHVARALFDTPWVVGGEASATLEVMAP